MKKKKALLALIVVAIVVSIGALGYLALSYFGSNARSSNAGGELSIDYLVSEKDVVEEDTQSDSSKNIFQWLKERLASDKAQEEVTLQTDTTAPASTQSGMSQTIRQSEEAAEEDLTPIQQAAKDAQQTNTNKKKDDQTEQALAEKKRRGRPPKAQAAHETEPTEAQAAKAEDKADTKKNPEDEPPKEGEHKVFISIRCDTAVDKGMNLDSQWAGIVPSSGTILAKTKVEFQEGDTVFDVLCRIRDTYKIHVSYRGTNGAQYVDGINNLYEFDGGRWSGWMYCVNDWYPNYGCGQYAVKNGDVIEWNYTCNLGRDLGQDWMASDEWMKENE